MTDGSGDWTYRGRFGADDYDAGDYGADDEYYSGTGRAGRPGYDPEGMSRGWTGDFERPGYDQLGPTERTGDPYYQSQPGGAGRYGQPGGYDAEPGGLGEAGGYSHSAGYGDAGGYGSSSGYGRYSQPSDDDRGRYGGGPGGQDPYLAGPSYADAPYQPGDTFGHGSYDTTGSFGRYGRDPYGQSLHGDHESHQPEPDRTSAYEWPGHGSGGASPAPQQRRALTSGSADGYGATGSFGDTGSFGQADTGSFGRADSGTFGRADSGTFARGDSGTFGRTDTGSFGRDDVSRGQTLPPGRSSLPGGSDGYAQWHADPAEHAGWDDNGDHEDANDDDWADDGLDDDGPVSRFFGRGGRGGRGGDDHDDDGRRGRRARRPRRLRGRLATVVAILMGALVLGAVADYGYESVKGWINNRYGDYSGSGYGTVHVTVPAGASLSGLGPLLVKDGVIMSLRPYDSAASNAQNASSLQPGVYVLHHHMSAKLAVAALLNPKNRAKDQITIIEGWRASRIAATLAKQTGLPASQFSKIIAHPPASLGLPKWAPAGRSAEGFLFPDTYTLAPHMTALQILKMMVNDFNQRTASLHIQAIAQAKSVTPYQMLVAASMIQAEAGSPTDFGKISRVIWNRIQQHIKLDFDSTVFYAMGTYGTYVKTSAQLNFNSRYNTYKYFGLPPGPIDSPGVAAIQAALHAPKGSELYFITDLKTHVTHFTSSYTQFKHWQLEFQG